MVYRCRTIRKISSRTIKQWWGILLAIVALVGLLSSCQPQPQNSVNTPSQGALTVASKGFTEQDILQELLAQQIENKTGLQVNRRRLTGFTTHKAIVAGEVDAYVEYSGTAYTGILAQKPIPDPKEVYRRLQTLYAEKFNLAVLPSLGFNNTFALVIRGEDARRYQLQTLSQVAKYAPQWQAGVGYEFLERPDGYTGLTQTYQLQFAKSPRVMDLGLLYRALLGKQVDIVAGNSTDGQIARLGLVILADDKHYFPPYEAVPIVRTATLNQYPQLREAINQLAGKISAQEMQQMNYRVEGELQDVKAIVREFLKSKGLS